MFIGLQDFDIDIFLRMDDQNIHIYYIDFETLPQIANIVPLGSFDDEGKFPLVAMDMSDRIKTGMEFLHRDFYAEYEEGTMRSLIRVDRFLEQFSNIPEVVEFFEPYLELCEDINPPDWCTTCQEPKKCPEYCKDGLPCSISIPASEFIKYDGAPNLRFKVEVPANVLTPTNIIFPNLVQIETKVETYDSNGNVAYGEDEEIYNLYEANTRNLTPEILTTPLLQAATITIDYIPTANDVTPTFTGTSHLIKGNILNISISTVGDPTDVFTATVFDKPNGTWEYTIPDEYPLEDGRYIITVTGSDKYDNVIQDSNNFTIDITAAIYFTDVNNGVINLEDTQSDMSIHGATQSVDEGQEVTTTFNNKTYTSYVQDSKFTVIIPKRDMQELLNGLGYKIVAVVHDHLGNQGTATEFMRVDLDLPSPEIIINPNIDSTMIKQHIDNNEDMLVDGSINGAQVGDNVIVYVNKVPYHTTVYAEEYISGNLLLDAKNIDYSDLYYLIVLYFNGIYRVEPLHAQDFSPYEILTDIDFEINKYSLIVSIKEFFTREFIYFLKCIPGSLPFANDYGSNIKLAIQTKNFIVQRLEVQTEIQFFIQQFNKVYGDFVHLKDIVIISRESDIGADSWLIEVYADIKKDRLVYRLEI